MRVIRIIKRAFTWYFMLKKRLLKKPAFALLLVLIPLAVFAVSAAARGDSGVVRIALAAEDISETASREIIESLTSEKSVVLFETFQTPKDAVRSVESGKNDAAWVLASDIEKKAASAAGGEDVKLAKIYQRERENVFLKMSAEKLYGKLFKYIAYPMYENFLTEYFDGNVDGAELFEYNKNASYEGKIVEFEALGAPLGAGEEEKENDGGILTSPIRGLVAVMIAVCIMASEMFVQKDRECGAFSRIPQRKRVLVSAASDAAASSLACGAGYLSLVFTGDIAVTSLKGMLWEAAVMLMYGAATVAMCVFLGLVLRSPASLGAAIPVLSAAMLVASPIFLNFASLGAVRYLFLPFYYLNAVYHGEYLVGMAVYAAAAVLAAALISRASSKRA